jgi:hypothetical protein
MANTLTNLIPLLFSALDVVSREQVGFLPAVTLDATGERAALNQVIRTFQTPQATASDITPSPVVPTYSGQTIGSKPLTITKSKAVGIPWTGEEILSLQGGFGIDPILRDQAVQAMRTLVNLAEADVAAQYAYASRVIAPASSTPFSTNLADSANLLKALKDNGAPEGDMHLVINTTAGAALRSLANLTRANEAGTTVIQRQGTLINLAGFEIRESAAVVKTTAGTGASYLINNSGGYAVGSTTLAVDTGSGTIIAGDYITIGSTDTNKYLVTTALAAGSLVIAAPGLLIAAADNATVTVGATYSANMAFTRNAIAVAMRAPAVPRGGDLAVDSTIITDPRSGISFEIRHYKGYRMETFEVGLAWGVAMIKSEHSVVFAGA